MTSSYKIVIAKYPIDAIKLAVKTAPEPPSTNLIIGNGGSCAEYFGQSSNYAGLSRLFQTDIDKVKISLKDDTRECDIIFSSSTETVSYSELVDRLRDNFEKWKSVTLTVQYDRIETDLPPLNQTDEIVCFWEIRDLLTDNYLKYFQCLSERIKMETPVFHGVYFYTRKSPILLDIKNRQNEIEKIAQFDTSGKIIEI
ncbi:MAG: hypothetical protein JNN15_06635 [Blastocatellia bacterium]|nr:hypothetical protein [Blastocatellia bacterium]